MSREQRRQDRKAQRAGASSGGSGVDRRTPVKAPGGGFPWAPVIVAGGTLAIVLLIAYLIFQATGDDDASTDAATIAEWDDSPDLPGVWYPPQGRGHFDHTFSTERAPLPFCDGVEQSDQARADSAGGNTTGTPPSDTAGTATAPTATSTPAPTNTPASAATSDATSDATSASGAPDASPTPRNDCYVSNPASSGEHLGVARNIDLGNGVILPVIPPDPRVYDPDVVIPREAVPHILEHAGVYIGYNCADGDDACQQSVADLEDLVNDRLDRGERVVMSRSTDLPVGMLAAASWSRVMMTEASAYDPEAFTDFISTHECRFDPEGFC